MKPFVIYTYDYDPGVGGIKVMHKLCHLLNQIGYPCYLMPIHVRDTFNVCSDYNTPLITQEIFDNISDAIVIYPEGIHYNPLNSKNVVRWILGPANQTDYNTYSDTDLIYWYMDYYYTDELGSRENQLMITEFHSNIFQNKNVSRNGSCYSIRKGNPKSLVHPADSIEIKFHDAGNLSNISSIFNATEKFYCYDNYTFLSIQAAMCGCISIVIPDGTKTKEEWLMGSRFNPYGVAFGETDIDRAIETLPLLYKEIEIAEEDMIKQVNKFVERCKERFI
jgi:hypothetical protein